MEVVWASRRSTRVSLGEVSLCCLAGGLWRLGLGLVTSLYKGAMPKETTKLGGEFFFFRQKDKWFHFLSSNRPKLKRKCHKTGGKAPKGQTAPFHACTGIPTNLVRIFVSHYSLRRNCFFINTPGGHLCNFIVRLAETNSPESQICNSDGPCSKHRNYTFQKLIRMGGRSDM